MHYPFNAFAIDRRQNTIFAKDQSLQSSARPYRKLSNSDVIQTNRMYKCDGKCTWDRLYTENFQTLHNCIWYKGKKHNCVWYKCNKVKAWYSPCFATESDSKMSDHSLCIWKHKHCSSGFAKQSYRCPDLTMGTPNESVHDSFIQGQQK